jgi:hypothetical protein
VESNKLILSTTLYEKNFRSVLSKSHWFFNISSPSIFKKVLILNNIKEDSLDELHKLINLFTDDDIIFVDGNVRKDSLKMFMCDLKESDKSYWYSIQYFCQMYTSEKLKCDYLMNVGADCEIKSDYIEDFIENSIKILNENDKVLLTTMPWAPGDFSDTGMHEQNFYNIAERSETFWFSKVVSDQVFIVKPKKLMGGIFNNIENLHPFPGYGGDSFEKRFCNHLIRNNYLRAIYKKYYYTHVSY